MLRETTKAIILPERWNISWARTFGTSVLCSAQRCGTECLLPCPVLVLCLFPLTRLHMQYSGSSPCRFVFFRWRMDLAIECAADVHNSNTEALVAELLSDLPLHRCSPTSLWWLNDPRTQAWEQNANSHQRDAKLRTVTERTNLSFIGH